MNLWRSKCIQKLDRASIALVGATAMIVGGVDV